MIKKSLLGVLVALMAVSPAMAAAPAKKPATTKVQPTTSVETSGPKPAWVSNSKDYFVNEGKGYYKSMVADQLDLSLAKERAKFKAIGDVRSSIIVDVETAFGETQDITSNDLADADSGRDNKSIKTDLVAIAERLKLSGIQQEESYWEKRTTKTPDGRMVSVYTVYVLVSMPERMRKRSQQKALDALYGKQRNSAREHLNERMEEMRDGEND